MSVIETRPTRTMLQRLRIALLRLLFVVLLVPILFLSSAWTEVPAIRVLLHGLGILCVFAAVLGRLWAILYIGGRKNTAVMDDGPYSVCRHPLYLFSTIGAFGLGLLLGSVTLAVLTGGVTLLVLVATARDEETYLRRLFGPAYDEYAARVPLLLPAFGQFTTAPQVTFDVGKLRTNFGDALVFLGFVPFAGVVNLLHAQGILTGIAVY